MRAMLQSPMTLLTTVMTSPNDNLPTLEQIRQFQQRRRELTQPWEEITPEQRESVRILDAQQSLSSPLYRKKAEELGMEEYFRQYSTTRVR